MTSAATTRLPTGIAATLATLYEATAPKPGNVHPGASFDDLTYSDFVVAALVTGPVLTRVRSNGVGRTVLDAVRATREAVGTNTNLGTLLLIAPLAVVPEHTPLTTGISDVLDRLTTEDTRHVYEAIRLAAAGGLGRAEVADVHLAPPQLTLVEVMQLAAERDLVARQYTNQFADVVRLANWIAEAASRSRLSEAIVAAHVRQLAVEPDSLIARKCGPAIAAEALQRAAAVVATSQPGESPYLVALAEYDAWLRADGHRRNPGTTADLIAAALFVLLREGTLHWTEW